jgi:hypothetical protein
MMGASWILTFVAAVLAALAVIRLVRNRGRWDTAARTWTLIAVIFIVVVVYSH